MQGSMIWVDELRMARARPEFYIGSRDPRHAIANGVEVATGTPAFGAATTAVVELSGDCWALHARGEALRPDIAEIIPWGHTDLLFLDLERAGSILTARAVREPDEWLRPFLGIHFGGFVTQFHLATQALVGVRTGQGLWCQVYAEGWPTTPPFTIGESSDLSLVVAARLSDPPFVGLPLHLDRGLTLAAASWGGRAKLNRAAGAAIAPPRSTARNDVARWLRGFDARGP